MPVVESLNTQVIESPPSCISFCPDQPTLLVIGTYVLHASKATHDVTTDDERSVQNGNVKQIRTGSLLLYELVDHSLTRIHEVLLSAAVLDIEWSPYRAHGDLLAVACSTGSLEFHQLSETRKFCRQATLQLADAGELVLDIVWHPVKTNTIGITLSGGQVLLCHIEGEASTWSDSTQFTLQDITTHQLEPWTLSFSSDGTNVFSGGDDSMLQCSHIDPDQTAWDAAAPVWKDGKTHFAGVTAILPVSDSLIITGSYDDHIRLLHRVQGKRVATLAEANLGGGVWRLKMLTSAMHGSDIRLSNEPRADGTTSTMHADGEDRPRSCSYTLLASCMHAGCRVVRLTKRISEDKTDTAPAAEWSFEVLAEFNEHKSMNYGSDVQPSRHDGATQTIVSTSFYDRLICMWQYREDKVK